MVESGGRPPLTTRKKWTAITVATVVLMVSYWLIVFAFVVGKVDDGEFAPGPPLALGLALVPFVFIALAMLSDRLDWPGAVLKAMGIGAVVGVGVAAISPDAVSWLVAGFGAGGIAALRAEEHQRWTGRAIAVVAVTLYVIIVLQVVAVAGLVFAPLLPLPALAIADAFMDHKAARAREAPAQTTPQ